MRHTTLPWKPQHVPRCYPGTQRRPLPWQRSLFIARAARCAARSIKHSRACRRLSPRSTAAAAMDFSDTITHDDISPRPLGATAPVVAPSGRFLASVAQLPAPEPPAGPAGIAAATSKPARGRVVLLVRSTRSLALKFQLDLDASCRGRPPVWYVGGQDPEDSVPRLLVAGTDAVHVFDLDELGEEGGRDRAPGHVVVEQKNWGPNVPIEAAQWGTTPNVIVLLSAFEIAAAVWSLPTRQSVEIFNVRALSLRPSRSGARHLTVVTRPVSQDYMTVLDGNAQPVVSFPLRTIRDLAGHAWSPDGRWLACYDMALELRVAIYTATGTLYRTYTAPGDSLGASALAWSPSGNLLAVAGLGRDVLCLNTTTFRPAMVLGHRAVLAQNTDQVFVEQDSAQTRFKRAFAAVPLAAHKPDQAGFTLAFSPDGAYLATTCRLHPTTLWIWALEAGAVPLLAANVVFLQPVQAVKWCPQRSALLLAVCGQRGDRSDAVYVWNSAWRLPARLAVPVEAGALDSVAGAGWVHTGPPAGADDSLEAMLRVVVSAPRGALVVGYLDDSDEAEPVDDDERVRRLIEGAEQRDWADNVTQADDDLDDTFAMARRQVVA
ncbi:Quino protein amine dehydrogenase [Dipodascopsis tothii]|uniref:Quino protein amine dehydrogenase n=1 Tax=Dipodascopsis tothii TaxID=44089 RepID=UPI0034CF703A